MACIEKNELNAEANNITEILRKNFLNEQGLLIQGKVGDVCISDIIVDDFGDVAPFLSLYGGEDICKKHLDFLDTEKPYQLFTRLFEFTDLILGLVWYVEVGEYKGQARALALEISSYVIKNWYSPVFKSIHASGLPVPIVNGIDSTFIEVWTEMYRMTNNAQYLVLAKKTADIFISIRASSKMKLLPKRSFYIEVLRRKIIVSTRQVKIMKDNTNYCFGLLDLYRLTKDEKYIIETRAVTSELVTVFKTKSFSNILTTTDSKNIYAELTPSFAVIDYCCDTYKLTSDESYLVFAKELADFWIAFQDGNTGLMPLFSNGTETYFDCETDMAISLTKLHECTGDVAYLESSNRLLQGILSFHKEEKGFSLRVDVSTGKVVNGSFKTKFIALFVKLLHLKQQEKMIYEDSELFMLMKDR